MTQDNLDSKSGFITIIGSPNAGKSTLLNTLLGTKVSIVSPKVQTTRTVIIGILTENNTQLVFFDTPGIFSPRKGKPLEKAIVNAAYTHLKEADLVCFIVDATQPHSPNNKQILELLKHHPPEKLFLVLNKIDLIPDKSMLLEIVNDYQHTLKVAEVFLISSIKSDGTEHLKQKLFSEASEGPWMYDEDMISTAPIRFLSSEITREKCFYHLHQELPYILTVETEKFEEHKNGDITIHQIIFVTKQSYKKMILGKGGELLKKIGSSARQELSAILECKVHLFLFVKVRENWLTQAERYQYMGLENPS